MVYKFDFFASVRSGAVHLVIVWHERNLFCLPRQERFFLISGVKTGQNTEKTVVGAVRSSGMKNLFSFGGMQVDAWGTWIKTGLFCIIKCLLINCYKEALGNPIVQALAPYRKSLCGRLSCGQRACPSRTLYRCVIRL